MTGLAPTQVPVRQVSERVQASLSVQAVPSGLLGFEQVPVLVSQVPATWHWSSAVHVTVEVGLPQVPLWQVSPLVHALPSSHGAPLGLGGCEQVPVAGLQVPGSWHWSGGLHVTVEVGLPQVPFWQVSPLVQALPSAHGAPLSLGGSEQTPVAGLQVPTS